jgi:hypothetical protein
MFNIDFNKFILQLLPLMFRRPVWYAWMKSLVYPVKEIYNQFIDFREAKKYQLNHNGQVFSMEDVLNDRFDNADRRIYLTDGLTKDRIYLYTREEDKSAFLPKFIYNRADYADSGVDFIVWVPNAIVITLEEMYELRAKVDLYRINPKRYKVYRV